MIGGDLCLNACIQAATNVRVGASPEAESTAHQALRQPAALTGAQHAHSQSKQAKGAMLASTTRTERRRLLRSLQDAMDFARYTR
eukprot:203835-Pleurochrysis_carterae.AAC.3